MRPVYCLVGLQSFIMLEIKGERFNTLRACVNYTFDFPSRDRSAPWCEQRSVIFLFATVPFVIGSWKSRQ